MIHPRLKMIAVQRVSLLSATSLALLLTVTPHMASAQTFVWEGDNNNDFTRDQNWVGDTAPGATDSALISGPGVNRDPVLGNGDSQTLDGLVVEDNGGDGLLTIRGDMTTNTTDIESGGQITVSPNGTLRGIVTVDSDSRLLSEGTVDGTITSSGNLDLQGTTTGVVTTEGGGETLVRGSLDADGGLTVTGDDGAGTQSSVRIGPSGNMDGDLRVENGATARIENELDGALTIDATSDATLAGGSIVATDSGTGTVTNQGVFTADGTVEGRLLNEAGGTTVVDGQLTVQSGLTNTGTDSEVLVGGTDLVTGTIRTESGALTDIDGDVDGVISIEEGGTVDLDGDVVATTGAGRVVNSGGTLTAAGSIAGALRNDDGGQTTIDGDLDVTTGGIVNTGTSAGGIASRLFVDEGVTVTGDIATREGARTNIDGTVDGEVTNRDGTVMARGEITGDILNADGGQMDIDGNLIAGAGIQNTDAGSVVNVLAGNELAGDIDTSDGARTNIVGRVDGAVTVRSGGTVDLDGTVRAITGAGTVTNTGGVLTAGGVDAAQARIDGLLTNEAGGQTTIDGDLAANGGIENRDAGSVVTIEDGVTLTGDITHGTGAFTDIDGMVDGRVVIAEGSTVDLDGTVISGSTDGAVENVGGRLRATGNVDGSIVNEAGGVVRVDGDLMVADGIDSSGSAAGGAASSVIVDEGFLLRGDVTNRDGSVTDINGSVDGAVTNTDGSVTASGAVFGVVLNEAGGQMSVDGDLTVTSGITNRDMGSVVTVESGETLTGDIETANDARTNIIGRVDGAVTILSGATVDLDGTVRALTGAGTVTNTGGVLTAQDRIDGLLTNRSGGQTTIDGNLEANGDVDNTGAGSRVVVDGGVTLTGDIRTRNQAETDVDGAIAGDLTVENFATGTLAGAVSGELTAERSGVVTVDGNSTVGSAVTDDGTLAVAAGQTLTVTDGSVDNEGTVDVSGTLVGAVQGAGAVVMGDAAADITDDVQAGDGSDLQGQIGGALIVSGEAETVGLLSVLDGLTVADGGDFVVSDDVTTSSALVESGGRLELGALLDTGVRNDGTFVLTDPGRVAGTLTTGGTSTLSGGTIEGDLTVTDGITTVDGTVQVDQATTTAAGAELILDGGVLVTTQVDNADGSTVRLEDGVLDGDLVNDGTVFSDGTSAVSGDITNNGGAELTVASGELRADITNDGIVVLEGDVAGNITNSSTGDVEVSGNSTVGNIDNAGSLTVSDGGALDGSVTNDGVVRLAGGGTGDLQNNADGTVIVEGNVVQSGEIVSIGEVEVRDGAVLDVTAEGLTTSGGTTQIFEGGVVRGDVTLLTGANVEMEAGSQLDGRADIQGGTLTADGGTVGSVDIGVDGRFRVTDDVVVDGDVTNDGAINGTTSGEERQLAVGGTFTNNGLVRNSDQTGGEFRIDAMRIVLGENSDVRGSVVLAGAVSNQGTLTYDTDSTLGGALENAATGTVTVEATLDADGNPIDNLGDFDIQSGGTVTNGSLVGNAGTFTIAEGGELQAQVITNRDGGVMANEGLITGDVDNEAGGLMTSSGRIAGNVTNDGDLTVSGEVAGTLTSDGATTITNTLTATDLGVTGGNTTVTTGSRLEAATVDVTGGTFENAGTVDAVVTSGVDGTVTSSGVLLQGAALAGTSTLSGEVQGNLRNRPTGDLTIDAPLTVTGTVANVGDLTTESGTRLTAMGGLDNSGTATIGGGVTGDVTNSGAANVIGGVEGDVTNTDGALTFAGASGVEGDLTVSGGTVTGAGPALAVTGVTLVGEDGTLTGQSYETTSFDLDGALDLSGDLTAGLDIGETGDASVDGAIVGDVANAGQLFAGALDGSLANLTGSNTTIDGDITEAAINDGTLVIGGNVLGDLTNNEGAVLDFGPDFEVGGTFTNGADLTVGAGEQLTAGLLDQTAGTFELGGTLDGQLRVGDGAIGVLEGGARVTSGVRVAGTLEGADGARIDGTLGGDGTIDMADGNVGDVMTVGGLSGEGMLLQFDLDLTEGATGVRSDSIFVTGDATGNFELTFTLEDGALADITDDILLVSVAGDSDFTAVVDPDNPLPSTARTVFTVARTGSGDLVLQDQVNPAIGALAGNITLTQSLIGTLINRPTSPFVVGLAGETEPVCAPGLWTRASAGTADAEGTTTDSVNTLRSDIDADYQGIQFGGDFACFNGAIGGFDMAFGAIGGINTGTTTQPIFQLDPLGGGLTDVVDSVTDASFDQIYGGLYVTAARGPLVADLQVRQERTEFEFTNTAVSGLALGLTDQDLEIDATTISGSVSRSFQLGQGGWSVVPTAGFSFTFTDGGELSFDDGSTLTLDDHTTQLAFVGGTLSRTQVGASGKWAANYFVTGTYYADFSNDLDSTFQDVDDDILAEDLSSTPLGDYGEISIGLNYIRILDSRTGRQFNASARVDGRASDSLDSIGITLQARWQF